MSFNHVLKSEFYKLNRHKLLTVSMLFPLAIIIIVCVMMILNYEAYSFAGYNMQRYYLFYVFALLSLIYVVYVVFMVYKTVQVDFHSNMHEVLQVQGISYINFDLSKILVVTTYLFLSLLSAFVWVYASIYLMNFFMPNLLLLDYDIMQNVVFYFLKMFIVLHPIILFQFLLCKLSKNIFIVLGIPVFFVFFSFLIINHSDYTSYFLYNFTFNVKTDFEMGITNFKRDYMLSVIVYEIALIFLIYGYTKLRKVIKML